MPKRKCRFNNDYTRQWSFVKKGRNDYEAYCCICSRYIAVSHSGKSSIRDHVKTRRHQSFTVSEDNPKHVAINTPKEKFLIDNENDLISAAELTTAYKIVRHHQSFKSLDCNTKLSVLMYPDSNIAARQSAARTKATAIIKRILAPHSIQQIQHDLDHDVQFCGIMTDSSCYKSVKLFPLLVQYFTEDSGLKIKLLGIKTLANELSETIMKFCLATLTECKLPLEKVVAFGADNTNTNFGNKLRQTKNNVFSHLKTALNRDIEGIGCPAHILHNTASTAADVMSIDIEIVIIKLFKFFSMNSTRVDRLKELCQASNVEFMVILSHSRSRWLTLAPAIERVIKLWVPLTEFFKDVQPAPDVVFLKNFFENPLAELYIVFLSTQLMMMQRQIRRIEQSKMTIVEVKRQLGEVRLRLTERKKNKVYGKRTKQVYRKLRRLAGFEEEIKVFDNEVESFFETAVNYLDDWLRPLEKYEIFMWMDLDKAPNVEEVARTVGYLSERGVEVSDEYESEVACLRGFVEKMAGVEWKEKNVHERWSLFFKTESGKKNLLRICQYLFAIPGHNANVERVFSLIAAQWTKERNCLTVETIESIVKCVFNYNMSCTDFYNYVMKEEVLLKKVKDSNKYEWSKKFREENCC
uniref:Uncharacterized protein n=1 Tax=Cotesia congregata TaxID=51543 RepID=S6D4P3_COTCN|nr:hypothetical protein CcPL1.036 [Cotesia congregata]